MAKWRYDNVRALCAGTDPRLRASLRHAFGNQGMRGFKEVDNIGDLHSHLVGGEVDLLVTTLDMGGSDVGALMQQLRHARVGENPFVIVVTLLETPDPVQAKRAVDAGTDDLLLMPFQPAQLLERLDGFVFGRKPFVVTHDYIGPDRRGADRTAAASAPRLEVPNPVRWQVVANASGPTLKEQVRDATDRLNVHKMKSYGGQICFLAERIAATFGETASQGVIMPDIGALAEVGDDLARRMANTNFAEATELVVSLSALCERIGREGRAPKAHEVGILPSLSRTIRRVLDEDPEAVSWSETALQLSQIFPGLR